MAVLNNTGVRAGASGAGGDTEYQIQKSILFNEERETNLSRTPGSASNRQTWTASFWIKRNELFSKAHVILAAGTDANCTRLTFTTSCELEFSVGGTVWRKTNKQFLDVDAWYHIVVTLDTTNGTADDRCRMYVNGTQITSFATKATITQNSSDSEINNTVKHYWGRSAHDTHMTDGTYEGLQARMAHIQFVDGQALTADDFAFTNPDTNIWVAKVTDFTYGTNGYLLTFGLDGNREDLGTNNAADFSGTAALPILKTTADSFGGVLDPEGGVRDDANASHLVLAIPFTGKNLDTSCTDESNHINGSTSEKTVNIQYGNSLAKISSEANRWYGSSLDFQAAPDNMKVQISADSDLAVGTSNFTLEFWLYHTDVNEGTISNNPLWDADSSGNNGHRMRQISKTQFEWRNSSGLAQAFDCGPRFEWNHYAVVRSGTGNNETKIYVNGVQKVAFTDSQDATHTGPFYLGKTNDGLNDANTGVSGYIQDLRLYKTAKYTGAFTLPSNKLWDVYGMHTNEGRNQYPPPYQRCNNTNDTWNNSGSSAAMDNADDQPLAGTGLGPDKKMRFDLGASVRVEEANFLVKPTNNWSGGESTAFIMYHSDDPASNGQTTWLQGWTVTAAGDSGNNAAWITFKKTGGATKRYWSVMNGSGSLGNTYNVLAVNFGDTQEGDKSTSTDSPSMFGTDNGRGGEVRGNYPRFTMSQSGKSDWPTKGNLNFNNYHHDQKKFFANFPIYSGKWYWEVTLDTPQSISQHGIVRMDYAADDPNTAPGGNMSMAYSLVVNHGLNASGPIDLYRNGSEIDTGSQPSMAAGRTLGIAVDMDNQKMYWSDNGSWTTDNNGNTMDPAGGNNGMSLAAGSGGGKTYIPVVGHGTNQSQDGAHSLYNFGSRPFRNQAPTGYKALCTTNLPDQADPKKQFGTIYWTGNGSARTLNTDCENPGMAWIKNLSATDDWEIYDQIRGTTKRMAFNTNAAESTNADGLTAFNSSSIAIGTGDGVNTNTEEFAGLLFNLGAAAATPSTSGDINPSAQWVNDTAGFSISKYTGTGGTSDVTIGHGLSKRPGWVVCKRMDDTGHWEHNQYPGTPANKRWNLSQTSVPWTSNNGYIDGSAATSTLVHFKKGDNVDSMNTSGAEYIMYCFAEVPGVSCIGKYDIINSNSGTHSGTERPWIPCGFKPQFVLIRTWDSTANWLLYHKKNQSHDVNVLLPAGNGHSTWGQRSLQLTSFGFRPAYNQADHSYGGWGYQYFALAENPFKTARGS